MYNMDDLRSTVDGWGCDLGIFCEDVGHDMHA
jgi:hypothetical protein